MEATSGQASRSRYGLDAQGTREKANWKAERGERAVGASRLAPETPEVPFCVSRSARPSFAWFLGKGHQRAFLAPFSGNTALTPGSSLLEPRAHLTPGCAPMFSLLAGLVM